MSQGESRSEEPTESSWTLDLGSLHGTDLGPLRVCDSCVVWSDCESPSSEITTCPWHLAVFWKPVPHTLYWITYPALMQGEEFGPDSTW